MDKLMMKKLPWVGLSIGLIFTFALYQFSLLNSEASIVMPALASLFMAEIGGVLTAAAAFIAGRELRAAGINYRMLTILVGNILLVINFIVLGLALWQKIQAG
jgi:hypothetical protein